MKHIIALLIENEPGALSRVVALFSAVATWIITKLADMLVGLRVDAEHETQGLDFTSHGETGYHTR